MFKPQVFRMMDFDYRTGIDKNVDANNREFLGVRPEPKPFQPFFRFHGSTNGAVECPNYRDVVSSKKDIGQPKSLAYYMEQNNVKPGKVR